MLKENFVEFLEKSIKSNWDIEALADYGGGSFTYKDVAERIARIHIGFEISGVKKGDKIALIGKNSTHWSMVFLATVTYGAVIVPILPDFIPENVHHIVNHSDSIVFFAGDSLYENLDIKEMPALKAVFSLTDFKPVFVRSKKLEGINDRITAEYEKRYPGGLTAESFKTEKVSNNELAEISYTSGTTGFSKGVMLSHNSLIANIKYAHENMPLQPRDRIVSFLPQAHSYGCAFEFLFPFTLGCYITFLGKTPTPQVIMQAFGEIKPRLILAVPLVIEKIFKKQLLPVISKPVMKILLNTPLINNVLLNKINKKLTAVFGGYFHEVVIGGAAFNKEAEDFFKKMKFPFSIGYGMTECGPLISYAGWKTARLRAAGKMVDTLEVKIDSDDPYNTVGEIMVRGENVMLGYYKNEEATKAVIDEEGWLHTGDLGVIDKDNFVYIRGRSKDMLLGPSGQNIYPEELEAKINNMKMVVESVVIQENNKLVALVYPDFDQMKKENITEEGLQDIFNSHKKDLNKSFPGFMNVAEFRLHREEFAKTPKKSIKRFLYT
ncbi:MAG: AMP-binding protein [Bacteroidales bacterium]|nr:AMP-binding protein [Bacteroidales bacterium]